MKVHKSMTRDKVQLNESRADTIRPLSFKVPEFNFGSIFTGAGDLDLFLLIDERRAAAVVFVTSAANFASVLAAGRAVVKPTTLWIALSEQGRGKRRKGARERTQNNPNC